MAKFRTRARALDMLGRQQIAGIPTAISELFKNAHDAYADNVEVDYFRKQKIFVLRDDGLGMTKDDFEQRWLVLGTESKFDNKRISPPPIDPSKKQRAIMGEKGVGRLAISSIGRQVLIVSRPKREEKLGKSIAALINWGIFEIPGLDLEDISIPLIELSANEPLPNKKLIESMKKELIKNIYYLKDKEFIFDEESIILLNEINSIDFDPESLDKILPGTLSLKNNSGTHFYIFPTNEIINSDIDSSKPDSPSKIEKFLIGFTQTMTPGHLEPNITASFRDHKNDDGTYTDMIDKESFFTPDDFKDADHHFFGSFDEYGQFSGKVTVYNQHEFAYKLAWNGNNFNETACGPFSINVSYLQGSIKQSTLEEIRWSELSNKLIRFGGLYIYKDGIRILPYGDNDYDFLDIEKNRTKSAGFYFFSYRRMLGVINISRKNNQNLIEKAGREGFIENKAYKQIREILKYFFVQLAADVFREKDKGGGLYAEYWESMRKEREIYYQVKEQREKRVKERKTQLKISLKEFFEKNNSRIFEKNVDRIVSVAENNFAGLYSENDLDIAAKKMIEYEINAKQELSQYTNEIKINPPRGFIVSQDLRRDWEAYLNEFGNLKKTVVANAEKKIMDLVELYKNKYSIEISKRKRVELSINSTLEEAKTTLKKKKEEANSVTEILATKVRKISQELMEGLENKIRETQLSLKDLKISSQDDENLYEEIKKREEPILEEKEHISSVLESMIEQIDSIYLEKDSTGRIVSNKDIEASLEEEICELKDKITDDVELTQLGLAINILHHEFNSTVSSMRNGIKDLKRWADVDEKLELTYKNIRANFEHLDGYLALFTPLNRRLYRKEETFDSDDIYNFLRDVFKGRLERHCIKIIKTKGFAATKITGLRSVFYPVFINVVDNAIYWLKQKPDSEERIIRLHTDKKGIFFISNNGPAISPGDKDIIFKMGFTRKENGRGMGLPISKEVLRNHGYEIFVDNPRLNSTVTFTIKKIDDKTQEHK